MKFVRESSSEPRASWFWPVFLVSTGVLWALKDVYWQPWGPVIWGLTGLLVGLFVRAAMSSRKSK